MDQNHLMKKEGSPEPFSRAGAEPLAQPGAQPSGLTLAFMLMHLCSLSLVTQHR